MANKTGVQQFSINWNRNENIGNGHAASTQTVWRPTIADHFYTEIKAGVGIMIVTVPLDLTARKMETGFPSRKRNVYTSWVAFQQDIIVILSTTYMSPFVSYQLMVLKGYSKSIGRP